jgi:UDP-N-acetylmuramoylalanine--D-glutamate ligase
MLDWSSYKESLTHQNIAVFGLGRSGLAVVRALVGAGIGVTAWDDTMPQIEKAKELGAHVENLERMDLSGFDCLILAPGIPYSFAPHPVVKNAQEQGLEIIGDIELLHRVGHGLTTIGITGTNGKSTTTALMNHVLNACGRKAKMGGNIGTAVFDMDFSDESEFLVLELSSYQLDLCPTFRPDYSILLNITSDHLDRHGSMQAYIDAKATILDGQGVAVIDTDDDYTQTLFDMHFMSGSRKYIPTSVRHQIPEGYYVRQGVLYHNHHGEDEEMGRVDSFPTLKGPHNHQNMVCTFTICKEVGLAAQDIMAAFESFEGLPHRQYLVTQKDNVTYINDSKATNAEAASKAFSAFENIFWIAGGRPKEGGLEGIEIFKDRIERVYLIGEAAAAFAAWMGPFHFDFTICGTLDKAVAQAHDDAQKFDGKATVLLSPACASWDQFSSFEERGNKFTELVQSLTGEAA